MAFNPNSTIYLCNVPIDNTYQNQIYFSSKTEQQNYFSNRVVKTFSNYLTVRKTLPDGSLVSSVKVDSNIDDLYNCNYMYYQNANHGTRFFYAFITKLIYVNEGTTEIVFETDVYQTWRFDVTLKQSYVVREHSTTDNAGDNIVPEKFNFQDYTYKSVYTDSTLNSWGYLVACTEHNFEESWWEETFGGIKVNGKMISGIYQGVYFFYYTNTHHLNRFLEEILDKEGDCVLSIVAIPEFNVSANSIGATSEDASNGEGWLYYSGSPATKTLSFALGLNGDYFDGYTPKNKKLYTSPFCKLVVSNHNGEQAEYNIEDFSNTANIQFTMYGDVSVNPSVTLVPRNYKNLGYNYDCGISITGFPQASFNTDTYKLWLAKNQFSVGMGAITGIGEIVGGVAMIATGAGAGVGAGLIAHGATGVLNTANSVYQASREPNKAQTGGAKSNLLTAMGMNKYDFYVQAIKPDYARTVDNFFTMYGYQMNRVKVPNVSSRPYFNYVQTIDVNIVGAIPDDDMRQMKAMYNNGVTLWKSTATVGDYSVNNSPS